MLKLIKTVYPPFNLVNNYSNNYEQDWRLNKVKDGDGIATESEAVALGGKTPSGYDANRCLIQSRVSLCGCKTSITSQDPNQCVPYKYLSKAAIEASVTCTKYGEGKSSTFTLSITCSSPTNSSWALSVGSTVMAPNKLFMSFSPTSGSGSRSGITGSYNYTYSSGLMLASYEAKCVFTSPGYDNLTVKVMVGMDR